MKRPLALAAGLLLLASLAGAASIEEVPETIRAQLGLRRAESGWIYAHKDVLGGSSERFLTPQDLERLGSFFDTLLAKDADPELAMAKPLLSVAGSDSPDSARARLWFERKGFALALTAEGKASAVAAVLGDEAPAARETAGQRLRREHAVLGLVIPLGETDEKGGPRGETRLDATGALPVDWDGDRRGHALPPDAEAGRVLGEGKTAVDVMGVSSNYIYGGCRGNECYSERYEGETLGLDVRKGLRVDGTPVEVGLRLKAHKDGVGFQNRMIEGVEKSLHAANPGRFGTSTESPLPHGGFWTRDGATIRNYDGYGSSVGDVLASAKIALLNGEGDGWAPRVAARLALNVATASREFTRGNYAGAGLGVTQRLTRNLTLNGELRATQSLDKTDVLGLPLKQGPVPGFTLALTEALSESSAIVLQIDKNVSPYKAAAGEVPAYGESDDGLSIGYTKILKTSGGKSYIVQVWERENVIYHPPTSDSNVLTNLLSRVRFTGNQAPDNQLGVRVGVLY